MVSAQNYNENSSKSKYLMRKIFLLTKKFFVVSFTILKAPSTTNHNLVYPLWFLNKEGGDLKDFDPRGHGLKRVSFNQSRERGEFDFHPKFRKKGGINSHENHQKNIFEDFGSNSRRDGNRWTGIRSVTC